MWPLMVILRSASRAQGRGVVVTDKAPSRSRVKRPNAALPNPFGVDAVVKTFFPG